MSEDKDTQTELGKHGVDALSKIHLAALKKSPPLFQGFISIPGAVSIVVLIVGTIICLRGKEELGAGK
ncbi:MAG: hypothetical protein KAT62_10855 [Desulfuromonadales bacterium]|nr:hypothetical protein [Desulfuromonadales bacterium]